MADQQRKRLLKKINASEMTSLDDGNLRRFRSKSTGKWGCCNNHGNIVLFPAYDRISHFDTQTGTREVKFGDMIKLFDDNWNETSVEMTNSST